MNLIILLFSTISFQFGMTQGDSLMAGIPKEQMAYKTFIPQGIFSDSLYFMDPFYSELSTKNENSLLSPRRTYFNSNRMAKYALAREDGDMF
ncbi:hypothetical protein [Anditalea andensis]|uniref:Uncharacterized protein n=1 Tax=Anditalea andensis TaxID=1048983 RepID=A0A074LE22_9BACT|nr:hypothetical protein [Anditalea andensis]KEO72032.1 hypothetical protein EL17_19140 [Anditalea andensis]